MADEPEYPPLPDWVKPGVTYRYHFPERRGDTPNRHHGRVFHIRGIVDNQAVIREWFKRRQCWNYTIEPAEHFEAYGERIKVVTKGKRK